MILLKFTVTKTERVHTSPDWLTNGHWAVRRAVVTSIKTPTSRAMAPLLNLAHGKYDDGYANPKTNDTPPDVARILPCRDGYEPAHFAGRCTDDGAATAITGLVFKTKDGVEVNVDPRYVPLFTLGDKLLVKGAALPMLVTSADEIVAVIMPRRA